MWIFFLSLSVGRTCTLRVFHVKNDRFAHRCPRCVFLQALSTSPWPGKAVCESEVPPRVSWRLAANATWVFSTKDQGTLRVDFRLCNNSIAVVRAPHLRFLIFPQWAVWGEPHQDYLPHVYCSSNSLHSQHTCGRFRWRRQVMWNSMYTRVNMTINPEQTCQIWHIFLISLSSDWCWTLTCWSTHSDSSLW